MSKNRCWRLRSRPVGEISDNDLELCIEDMPVASASGEMLIKNLFVSIDPTHRIWMSDKAQYMPAVVLGDVMRAATVGVVVTSNDPAFAVGQHVVGFGGLTEHYVGVAGQNVCVSLHRMFSSISQSFVILHAGTTLFPQTI
jgi:NADPH-dependent curcumin reductase CurA